MFIVHEPKLPVYFLENFPRSFRRVRDLWFLISIPHKLKQRIHADNQDGVNKNIIIREFGGTDILQNDVYKSSYF